MNILEVFKNDELGLSTRVVTNPDGSISINAEDTAIGFGWFKTEIKNGKEYTSIRWERMNGFSAECGFAHEWSKDDYIPESLFYRLGMKANNQNADKFQNWLAMEVIPSIRKNGGYIAGQENLSDEELLSKALMVAQKKIEEKNQLIAMQDSRIQEMRPKEIFADAVSASHTSILIGDLAKLICQNGYQIGQKRLFQWLRDNGYLIKRKGSDWNMPTQKSIEMGLFEIKESTHVDGNGCNITTRTPKATGKAQIYFVNKFLEKMK